MKLFGAREWGARLFIALSAIAALLGTYWAGAGLFRRRAGLLAALALGTMPLFFLQARQLTTDMPLVAGLAFAVGGFGRFAWPASGKRSLRDLAIGIVGAVVGTASGGVLLGAVLPCLALGGALVAGAGLVPAPVESTRDPLAAPGIGADVPADKSFGRGLLARGALPLALVVLAGLVLLVLTLTTANVAGKYSLLLGGVPRGGTPPQKFEYLIRQLGFGLFPWSAIAVFALGRAFVRLADEDGTRTGGRLAFGQIHLLVFAAFGFALSSVYVLMTGDARFPALAPIALAVGVFLDEALEGERAEPVLGLLAATGTMVVARDFFLGPEELVSVHLLNKVKWPPTLRIGPLFLAVGLVVGGGIYLGLATRGRALGRVALRDLGDAGALRRKLERLAVWAGRWGIQAAVAGAIVFALIVAHGVVPLLSRHFSFKPVIESYTRYAKDGDPIGKYRVEGHGSGLYSGQDMVDLPDHNGVVQFLRQGRRSFALVASDELAALDAAFKTASVPYFVVDALSSRFLLLSNQLGEADQDQNPLKKNVWMAPRPPRKVGEGADARWEWPSETPPWGAPRVAASAIFADSIELIGADFPETVRRPGKIPLHLHFRVLAPPPPGYMVFVHFDIPGEPRLIGDHAPLGGAFPTAHWLPGEYIKDFVEVDVPYMTTTPGTYTLFIGWWPGGERKRLSVTSGPHDGFDRVRIGALEIR
jgi:4-amino-4-deoxy-L-arabinose transferase-like glycosyltransferase